jgi:hypothetical protein
MLVQNLQTFRHHEVASLAWSIGSAPLMQNKAQDLMMIDEAWCDAQYNAHLPWLQKLDDDPSQLQTWLVTHHQKLLGKRFESLLAFWFTHSPHFELLHHNVLFSHEKNTIGEIDFIVRSNETDEVIHFEVACKYYIAKEPSSDWKNWIGPNGHDSLFLKMEKLSKQIKFLKSEQGKVFLKENHLENVTSKIWMKGYFFHHASRLIAPVAPKLAHPHYSSGWYITKSQLEQFDSSPQQWLVLPKQYWTCPFHFSRNELEIYNGNKMIEVVKEELLRTQKAVMVMQVVIEEKMLQEISRGFVVHDKVIL